MNKSPVPVQESSTFIHQRYEDAAHLIFHQQQKQWKKQLKSKHKDPEAVTEFAHYGNPGVLARAEAAERLASYKDEKSPLKKGGKEKKKEDKDSKKEKKEKEKEEKSLQKEEKSRSSKREKSFRGSKKEKEGSLRRSDSEKGAHGGEDFREKYTPLASPSLAHNNHRDLSLPSPRENSFSSDNSSLPYTPNRKIFTPQKLPYDAELKNLIQKRSRQNSVEFSSSSIPYTPNDSGVTSPESIAESPRETVIGAEAAPSKGAGAAPSRGAEKTSESSVVNRLESNFDAGEGRVSLDEALKLDAVSNPYVASEGVDLDDETFDSGDYPPSYSADVHRVTDPDVQTDRAEELLIVEEKLVLRTNGTDTNSPRETLPGSSELHEHSTEQNQELHQDSLEQKPELHQDSLEQKADQETLEREDSFVEFGHYGNTGIIAKKQAVARAASILRKDKDVTESKVCALM